MITNSCLDFQKGKKKNNGDTERELRRKGRHLTMDGALGLFLTGLLFQTNLKGQRGGGPFQIWLGFALGRGLIDRAVDAEIVEVLYAARICESYEDAGWGGYPRERLGVQVEAVPLNLKRKAE